MPEDFQTMKHLKLIKTVPYEWKIQMLQVIFRKQEELFKKYPYAKKMSQENLTKIYAQAIASEAQELMNQTNWKPWKKSKKKFNKKETIFEYIDILHFVVNGLIALGVDAETCMRYYLAKNEENKARIKRRY